MNGINGLIRLPLQSDRVYPVKSTMTKGSSLGSLLVLGIETSCDETAAAVVRRDSDGSGTILANVVRPQLALHAPFGGVVPEVAARAHVEVLDAAIVKALGDAQLQWDAIDGVAATAGPGLIGGLIVGQSSTPIAKICSVFIKTDAIRAISIRVSAWGWS